MKTLRYLSIGIFFGIVLFKAQVVSWYRIYEMFKFESFHMYGVIGVAVVCGMIVVQVIKRKAIKGHSGAAIDIPAKNKGITRYLIGGIIFGMGWAIAGACPGPMFVLLGSGVYSMLIVIGSAVLGTLLYGVVRHKLPH